MTELRGGEKWRALALYLFYFAIGYNVTSRFHFFEPSMLPITPVDRAIPFMPWTVWIYLSEYPFFFIAVSRIKDRFFLNKMIISFLICFTCSFAVFFLFPTTFPREDIIIDKVHDHVLSAVWLLDRPLNCFPSLHVSTAFLIVFGFMGKSKKWTLLFGLWSIAIAFSTLSTKQHYFLDVLAGFALAMLIVTLVEWFYSGRGYRGESTLRPLIKS